MSKENNTKDKTILSNYSNNIYQKTKKYLHYNFDSSLSQSNDIKKDLSSNHEIITKKIFYDKLYKHVRNNNGRSLSEVNIKRNNTSNIRKRGFYQKENFLSKSYMNNYYTNSESTYNYNYDNNKILLYKTPLTERDDVSYKKYLNKNNEEIESSDKLKENKDEKLLKYYNLNYEKDLDNTNIIDKISENKLEKSNSQYLNNYFRKRCKNKSSLNSPQKAKIKEILIKSKISKNQYTTFTQNKNNPKEEKVQLIKNKNKKSEINDENKDISNRNNKTYEFTKLLYNNYITKKDKFNNEKQVNRNRNRLNILNKKKNKTLYTKFSNNLNNLKKILNNNNNKNQKGNIIKETKKDNMQISSFSFSLINNSINSNIIDKLKNELFQKNQKILEYQNKFIALQSDVEFYKNEMNKLISKKNEYLDYNIKQDEKKFKYKRNNYGKIENNLNKNYIKIIDNENNLNYDYLNGENQELSSKLKIQTDLNIDKDYSVSFNKSQIISDKCIFAISSLTKSKSILCFDYETKKFSFRDYADFGDFQDNYIKSLENIKENQKNKSIFLTIYYYFYIITGENCDIFYVYNAVKRTIDKLCPLKNNHSNGTMLNYNDDIVCISGNYNKKVELYSQSKNEWTDLPELQVERSDFTAVLFKNKYIFCLFGFNLPTKQYLNTIEYLDIENYNLSSWQYLKYQNENLLSIYLINSLGINYDNKKIIIVGGKNGQENISNEYFYQLIISNNFENNKNSYIEKTNRKLKDINKNKCYLFNKGQNIFMDNNSLFHMSFDDDLRVHLFNVNNMAHDVFYFN